MPFRVPQQLLSRTFTTTSRARTAIPPQWHAYTPELSSVPATQPKLGRIGKWYLPTMALIAVGMVYFPESVFQPSSRKPQGPETLDSANRQIGFAIANALGVHNQSINGQAAQQLTQDQKNQLLLDAFGDRSSLADMERAFSQAERERAAAVDVNERNRRLLEAYGDKASLQDLERAMEIYEVQ